MKFRFDRVEDDGVSLIVLSGNPTLEELQGALDEATAWLTDLEQRGLHTSIVIDPSEMQVPSAQARRMFGEWRAEHMPLITNVCICATYVAASAVMRGVLVAIFWVARPVIPVEIVQSRDEGLRWARERSLSGVNLD
jgi:hypothetical protein